MAFSRAMARAMMPKLVGFGWSAAHINKWLTGYGASYRKSIFLSDVRQIRQLMEFGSRVVSAPPTAIITKSQMSEVDLKHRERKYRIYATGKYTDMETGRVTYRNLSFYDDTTRSKQGWADEFEQAQLEIASAPGTIVSDINILAVEHNRTQPY